MTEIEKRRVARQQALTRIGEIISNTLALEDLLQTAVVAICEHLHFADVGFLLPDEDDPQTLLLVARSGLYADLLQAITGKGFMYVSSAQQHAPDTPS